MWPHSALHSTVQRNMLSTNVAPQCTVQYSPICCQCVPVNRCDIWSKSVQNNQVFPVYSYVNFQNTRHFYSPNFSLICVISFAALSEILCASEETLAPSNKSKYTTRPLTGVSPYEHISDERIQLLSPVRLFPRHVAAPSQVALCQT